MFEELLVKHCSPTLAGIKTGNLFNFTCESTYEVFENIDKWNGKLNSKGIYLSVLSQKDGKTLIYVYRKNKLIRDLSQMNVRNFLNDCGYKLINILDAIKYLVYRIDKCEKFPHEIGLFLGYPISDVKGFIENLGRNSKCVGCWKVYSDEFEALKKFDMYKKCTNIYCQKLMGGTPILKLTVAA